MRDAAARIQLSCCDHRMEIRSKMLENMKNKEMLRQGFSFYFVPTSVVAVTVGWRLGSKMLESIKKNKEMLQ